MFSVPFFKFRFTNTWAMLCLTALVVFIFLRLGFWQLHRADEKKQMILAAQQQEKFSPREWVSKQHLPNQYERLHLTGNYLSPIIFLDNQHHEHQFGYHALSPFKLTDGTLLLVDRGWVPVDLNRRRLPLVKSPPGLRKISGVAYFPSQNRWVLGPAWEKKEKNRIIVEQLDTQLLSHILQKEVYPFIIRLDKNDSEGFVREWRVVSMPPQRHLGYAVQWFALALTVLILFIVLSLKKNYENKIT